MNGQEILKIFLVINQNHWTQQTVRTRIPKENQANPVENRRQEQQLPHNSTPPQGDQEEVLE